MESNKPPRIWLWYGNHQRFGGNGRPQRWINLLGRVLFTTPIRLLTYELNGESPLPLSIGPDHRRLVSIGDFNIDIDTNLLRAGDNHIKITAIDELGQIASEQVTVDFENSLCPLPYTIDWNSVKDIQQAAWVVDGHWVIQNGSASPQEIGYDRLLAIGDTTWKNYEVVVPITIHGFNGSCYEFPSIHAGVGLVMRWKGHSNWGADAFASGQPHFGPGPYGAIGWYCLFHDAGPLLNFFDPDFQRMTEKPLNLLMHVPFMFKVKAETLPTGESLYSMKVWEQERTEPQAWDLLTKGHPDSLAEGSCMLITHHVCAQFGKVVVTPV